MTKFSSSELSPREATVQFILFFAHNYLPLASAATGKGSMALS